MGRSQEVPLVEVEVTTFLQPSWSWMPPLYPQIRCTPPPGLDTPPVPPLQGLNEPPAPLPQPDCPPSP